MSSKGGSKANKRSTSVAKKKGGLTPDHTGASTASSESIGGGGGGGGGGREEEGIESAVDEVLCGPDIEALRIREEDLQKLHVPKPPSSSKPAHSRKRVLVRKTQHSTADSIPTIKQRNVTVLHPLPPEAVGPTSTVLLGSPRAGPRFDPTGTFIPHSILGSTQEYSTELKNREMVASSSAFTHPPPVAPLKEEEVTATDEMSYEKTITPREAHALQYWQTSMQDRKLQQQYLSNKLQSSPERLLMNHGDSFRVVQEERALIDRAIPSVDYGKGYRVGSEFWSQEPRIGDAETGISTTLTRTERGLPPELEFVGVPTALQREKGVDFGSERNAPLHYTWRGAPYVSTRRQQLGSTLATVEPFHPVRDMAELQVIGHSPSHAPLPASSRRWRDSLDSEGEYELSSAGSIEEEEEEEEEEDGTDATAAVVGPALRVGGQLLKWEGPPPDPSRKIPRSSSSSGGARGRGPVELRVLFDAAIEERVTSHLQLENCGTTVVYYSWRSLPRPNPLGTVRAGQTQRFYFDSRGGVLLPGQTLAFPFVFKSPTAGVFSETWGLQTGPSLCRGREVRVTLKGVSFQEDLNAGRREEIDRVLSHNMAVAAAEMIVNRLVDSICTPPCSPEPLLTTVMEEDLFLEKNSGFFYHYNVVQQLKRLYDEVLRPELLQEEVPPEPSAKMGKKEKEDKSKKGRASREKKEADPKGKGRGQTPVEPTVLEEEEEGGRKKEAVPDWDLSLMSLEEVVMAVEENDVREGKLRRLMELVSALSSPPPKRSQRNMYNICYGALCAAVDDIAEASAHLCQLMGLPAREMTSKPAEEEPMETVPSSPASGMKKDRKGGKDAKKGDAKQQKGGKERAPSSKSKAAPGKKPSRQAMSPKEQPPSEPSTKALAPVPSSDVDPLTEGKYRENFYTAVYGLLSSAVEKMTVLFEDVST